MNKTLSNPYYLFSFQHIASKERVSFFPQVITSNVRYDKFRFVENQTTNLSATPPQVFFEYLGQYYYSIYECITSASTDPSLAYNKLESGRAWVIVGDDNLDECFFEPYISNDENFAQVIYVSEEEENCIYPTPTPSSTPPAPSATPTMTPTTTSTPSNTPQPTSTPTPSITPPPVPSPLTLGALWWSQFSNPSFLNLSGIDIVSVIDGINASTLFKGGNTGPINPTRFQNGIHSSCESGFSGGTKDNPTTDLVSTLNGDYAWSPDITFFTRYIYSGTTGESFLCSSDSGGGTGGYLYNNTIVPYRWFQFKLNFFTGRYDFPYWADPENTSVFNQIQPPYSANTWVNAAFRVYQDGANYKIEIWENGSIIASTQTLGTAVAPTINPGVQQSADFQGSIAESFWFNRKLNNTEMAQMFSHLTTRYC